MLLPMLTINMDIYRQNRDGLLRYAARSGALVAPHVKTAMICELASDFVDAVGWGVTVADVRQASVMADAGLKRIMLANEVGGPYGARHLARLALARPEVEFFVFADSSEAVDALAMAWRDVKPPRPLSVLLEVGGGRAGARTLEAFAAALEALVSAGKGVLHACGVASYEGASAVADHAQSIARIDELLIMQGRALGLVRRAVDESRRLIATAGGSMYFDRVVDILAKAVKDDGNADLVIRPGAILFGDHGMYRRAFSAMDARRSFALDGKGAQSTFQPALSVWTEVLSRPEPGLAICGMGMRDVSYDADLPQALRIFRAGVEVRTDVSSLRVTRLNDQHAFVAIDDSDVRVGDVVEFGISHPCTCMHLWRTVQMIDASGDIAGALGTHFC